MNREKVLKTDYEHVAKRNGNIRFDINIHLPYTEGENYEKTICYIGTTQRYYITVSNTVSHL